MELVGDIKIGINCSGQDVKTDPEVDNARRDGENGNNQVWQTSVERTDMEIILEQRNYSFLHYVMNPFGKTSSIQLVIGEENEKRKRSG